MPKYAWELHKRLKPDQSDCWASILSGGKLRFNAAARKRYELRKFKYYRLWSDTAERAIKAEFSVGGGEGFRKLPHQYCDIIINCRALLDKMGVPYPKAGSGKGFRVRCLIVPSGTEGREVIIKDLPSIP